MRFAPHRCGRRTPGIELPIVGLALLSLWIPATRAAPRVQFFDRSQGLPSTQVHAVIPGSDGAIWFAGPSGLARYDGGRITRFGRDAGLSSHGLRSLGLDGRGRLWVGTDVGVDVGSAATGFQPLLSLTAGGEGAPALWDHGFVEQFAFDSTAGVWIAASKGLFHWSETGSLVPAACPALRDRLITSVAVLPEAGVWATASGEGLWHFDGFSWARVTGIEIIGEPRVLARGSSAKSPTLLVGGERGLVELDSANRPLRTWVGENGRSGVSAILEASDGVWAGAGGELHVLQRTADSFAVSESVIDSALINHLVLDRQDNIWMATDNRGVGKISALRAAVRRADTPCSTQVYSFAPSMSGDLLVGGDTCSWRVDPQTLEVRSKIAGLDRVKVWDLAEDSKGKLWAATQDGLFRESPAGRMRPVADRSNVLAAPGRALLAARRGMWVGTLAGLARVDERGVREIGADDGSSLGYVYTLERGPDGSIWVGTIGNGLWRIGEDDVPFRVEGPAIAPRGNVYSLDFLTNGTTVVLHDDRIVVIDGTEMRSLATGRDDAVAGWSVIADGRNRVWIGSAGGLVRYDIDDGRPLQRITRSMGLSGEEFTTSRSLWRSPDGNLHCGFESGYSRVAPSVLERFDDPPVPRLFDTQWSNATFEGSGAQLRVDYGRWTLDVSAFAPWFLDDRGLSYQHRLIGFDETWSAPRDAATQRIHYTGLPAGSYTLEARARSPLTGWGPAVSLMRFEVLSPWWRRTWFLALSSMLVALAIVGLWRRHSGVLVRRNRELERRVDERTAELQQAMTEMERLATYDDLTGVPNQRSFWERARHLAAHSRRHAGQEWALVVIDLDHFKQINDSFGHRTGDEALAFSARCLAQQVRDDEFFGRYGGEEFVALLEPANREQAMYVAERMRANLAAESFVSREGRSIPLRASLGVAVWQGGDDSAEQMFRRADAAVYAAKKTRNVAVCWEPGMLELEPAGAGTATSS